MNDSSVIISALSAYMANPKQGLTAILNSYPSIEYKDEEGVVKSEVFNRYSIVLGGPIPKGTTQEIIKYKIYYFSKFILFFSN